MPQLTRPTNWRHELTADHARRMAPASLLDVGCGSGWLLRALEGDAEGTGLEHDAELAASLREDGLNVEHGDAEALPFADESFDLVALRNVLHHMRDPATAIAEARRVTRGRLLITEPWFDLTFSSQRLGQSIDSFVKRVERYAQRFHADYHDADQILKWIGDPTATVHIERHLRPEPRTRAMWLEDVAEDLASLPEGHPLLTELTALDREMSRNEATSDGALIVLVNFADAG